MHQHLAPLTDTNYRCRITAAPGFGSLVTDSAAKLSGLIRKPGVNVSYRHLSQIKSISTVALSVFAALYVFHNEVVLWACNTLTKRLDCLYQKVEEGDDDVESDEDFLDSWRWKVVFGF